MKSIHDPRYVAMISHLKHVRKAKDLSQVELGKRIGQDQKYVSKVESLVRRLDFIELCDWLDGLGYETGAFLEELGRLKR